MAVTKSLGLGEKLRHLAGVSASSTSSAPSARSERANTAKRDTQQIDLLRMVGVNRRPHQPYNLFSPLVPTVTATKTDALFTDVDGDLQADPGDTLEYTVTINSTGEDATGVTFTDTVDPNTAFVAGSLTATPVAVNDSYAATGNVRISIAAPGVIGNDFAGVPSATISAFDATSANGGNVNVNGDGSFTYNPPAGFEGNDSFNYTLTNSAGSNNATVSITVSGMIWFVNNNASCPCDGRLTNPFDTLASFAAANTGGGNNPDVNDNIFLYESATDYVGPVTLLGGQKFIGQDASASLASITGLTPPAGSDPLPTTNSGNTVIVKITSLMNSIIVATNNTLTGFTGGDSATDIFGNGFGTLTVSDVILNGNGQAVDLTNGALAATFKSISANGGTNGIALNNTTGSFTVAGDGSLARNGSGGTITGTLDDAVALTSATSVTLQSMNLTNNGDTAAAGLTDAQSATGDHTVQILGGSGITLSGVLIQNPRGSGIVALDLSGTNSVNSDSLITGLLAGPRHGIYVNNIASNMSVFNFHNSAMRDFASAASAFFYTNQGASNSAFDIKGSTFEDLAVQAITAGPGNTAGTTGTITSIIGGPNAADRNFFQNAKTNGENNVALLVSNGATHVGTIQNNLFDNIAENGLIANTSIIRTQNTGGKMTAVVEDNVIQNITYAAGGRHAIGHIFEPSAFNASNFSDLRFEGNSSNVTYTALNTNREFIHIDYRTAASGGDIKILNNNFTVVGPGTQEMFELRFRPNNASTIDLLVDGNTGTGSTTARFLDIDSEAQATVNATVTNNNFTNANGTPGQSIDFASETATASLCANVSGNTLLPNTITLNEIAGNMTVTQASAAAVAAANSGATVTVGGTPTFGAAACSLPTNAMMATPTKSKTGTFTPDESESILFAGSERTGNYAAGVGSPTVQVAVQDAIARWEEAGVSAESLLKLRSISVEVADLPEGQLASANPRRIVVDSTAAGHGWFADSSPADDAEFELAVLSRYREALPASAAYGQMDLFTAVMRQLGSLLSPYETNAFSTLMQNTLMPGVRRTPATRVRSQAPPIADRVVAQSAQPESILYPQIATLNQRVKALRHHALINPRVAAAMLADVNLSIGTLPAGDSVTIKFRVTIDDPFTGAMAQVANQGTVSGTNFADVLTDDPTVGGTADPTVTPIDLPSVSVAVSPGSVAEDGATNLVYTFTRTGSTANSITVNFTIGGTASFPGDYSQTGAATFSPPNGSVVIPGGSATANVTVNPASDNTVESDETVDLTVAAGVGYAIGSPNSASGTITNDDTDVTIAVSPLSVSEDGATNLVYTFTRTGVTTNELQVSYTVGGSAVFPLDYSESGSDTFAPPVGLVTFTAGSTTAQVTIDPVADAFVEGDETVSFTLNPGTGYNVGTQNSATGTITNDDADVSVAVSPDSVAEDGATNLTYTFTRTGFTGGPLIVNYTIGGTATFGAGNDYTQTGATTFTPPTGTITFLPGNSTAVLTVDPEADATAEPDETVDITLAPGLGYNVVNPSSASGTILNDDTVVTVAVSPLSTAEGGANLVYTFTRSGSTAASLTVNFSVAGTASFPSDYSQTGATTFTPPTATVTFGAGNSTASVTVTPLTDCLVEVSETVEFTVEPGAGYGVGSPSTATGTITNTPDTTAPVINLIPNVNMTLWPPNHQYETVNVNQFVSGATDNCDGAVNVTIMKIDSDEVEDGDADGNTLNDIVIANDCESAQLRAERSANGNGRVYTITFKAVDSAGNVGTATAKVTVRKTMNTPAVDGPAMYTVTCP